jgi:membrane protein DedA with SNARE-associated domain
MNTFVIVTLTVIGFCLWTVLMCYTGIKAFDSKTNQQMLLWSIICILSISVPLGAFFYFIEDNQVDSPYQCLKYDDDGECQLMKRK